MLNRHLSIYITVKSQQKSLPVHFVGLTQILKVGQFYILTDMEGHKERYLALAENKRI